MLTKARRFTRAEAGTIYAREGNILRFAVVQNDALMRRLGAQELRHRLVAEPLELSLQSLAGYVGITGRALNIHDAYRISPDRPYRFDRAFDERSTYRTVSVFLIPIHDHAKSVVGVLQLINALDSQGRPTPFRPPYAYVERTLVSYAAIAIRHARAAAASVRPSEPPLTDAAAEASPGELAPSAPWPPDGLDGATGVTMAEAYRLSSVGRRLGDLLTSKGLISHEALGRALAEQNRTKKKLGAILVSMGLISENDLVAFLAGQYGIPIVPIPETVDREILQLVPAEITKKYELIPVERRGNSLVVAMSDPTNLAAVDDVAFLTSAHVIPGIAPPSLIRRAIESWYQIPAAKLDDAFITEAEGGLPEIEILENDAEPAVDLVELRSSSDQAPVVRIVNTLLLAAIRRGASDVHFEPSQDSFRVRFRVDGVLQQVMTPPKRLAAAITSRVKIMADMDIAEHRRPQDGHIRLRSTDVEADVRVATLPTVYGEGVILRILDKKATTFDPGQLGFDGPGLERLQAALRAKNGLILVTGPTGSGKTTTLYAALQSLNSLEVKLVTIEDPVEYHFEGISQVQVNEDAGRSFAGALRAFLRSDPDVIMVGEIRDLETAQTAVRAALTGHLVLSTLHTNDSPSTVARLLDMTIPPFLVSAALRLVVAQRLVRTICPDCRQAYEVKEDSLAVYGHVPTGAETLTLFRGKGCPACNFAGLKGRVAIYEMMPITRPMQDLIPRGPSIDDIRQLAREQGMLTLREAGLRKVIEGVTTVEEMLRVTAE